MEPEQTTIKQSPNKFKNLHTVTPLSKYLAMALFVLLPFIGGWVGYTFAPEKVVEVEKPVVIEQNQTKTVSEDIEQVKASHFLTVDGASFEISTSSAEDKTVIYESDSKMLFGPPWVVDGDESKLLAAEGTQLNDKVYISVWVQTANGTTTEAVLDDNYSWYLGELNPDTGEFELILDSSYLSLDDTYNRDQAMFLTPIASHPNSNGHIFFSVVLCERCGPGPEHRVILNYETRELTLLGRATEFEWTSTSTYRYKTESELGVSRLDAETKEYVEEHYRNCADHAIYCYQQIDWNKMPWIEKVI